MIDIRVPLQPKQAELLRLVEESPATWIGYGGARGGAKSHGARALMLLRRLKYPRTRGLIFRRTFEQLWENHIEPLFQQYPFMRVWYHTGHRELTLPNGSSIVFGYAEHPATYTHSRARSTWTSPLTRPRTSPRRNSRF